METIAIQIHVGNRELNIKVPAAEKENVLKAERLLNEKIAALKKNYAVNDNQDILAMCAFSLAGEMVGKQNSTLQADTTRMEKLDSLDELLNGYLSQPVLFPT
jgi:cell division protein ZapA